MHGCPVQTNAIHVYSVEGGVMPRSCHSAVHVHSHPGTMNGAWEAFLRSVRSISRAMSEVLQELEYVVITGTFTAKLFFQSIYSYSLHWQTCSPALCKSLISNSFADLTMKT